VLFFLHCHKEIRGAVVPLTKGLIIAIVVLTSNKEHLLYQKWGEGNGRYYIYIYIYIYTFNSLPKEEDFMIFNSLHIFYKIDRSMT
jgi:hypothetical protein